MQGYRLRGRETTRALRGPRGGTQTGSNAESRLADEHGRSEKSEMQAARTLHCSQQLLHSIEGAESDTQKTFEFTTMQRSLDREDSKLLLVACCRLLAHRRGLKSDR